MPDREKQPRSNGSRPARPFSRPKSARRPPRLPRLGLQRRQFTAETDSPLEGDGFEPSVPLVREEPRENSNETISKSVVVQRGTDGSNPSPSSGESATNPPPCR